MAKTLLQITQEILHDTGGDDVTSIFDTEEAEEVARHIVATYDNIVAKESWGTMRRSIQLVSVGDSAKPTYLTLPTNVKELLSLKYNKATASDTRKYYEDVFYKEPDDFLRYCNGRNDTDSTVDTITDTSGVEIFVRNDLAPTYYTSFDDSTLIFDSYDSGVESTLQGNKTQGLAYILPTLSLTDAATHDLPPDAERFLVEEAIVRVQFKQHEIQDITSKEEADAQRRTISRKSWKVNKPSRYPDYGRRKRSRFIDPTFLRGKR